MPVGHPSHAVEGSGYLGNELCGSCHPDQFETQPNTPMAKAMVPAVESPVLQQFPVLEFREGPFRYRVERRGDEVSYTVSDGSNTLSEPVLWAFGFGEFGQTYLLEHQGRFIESRVSFYPNLSGLDRTVGSSAALPKSLEEALGQPIQPVFARRCFSCHSTGSVKAGELQTETLTPGIGCEGCHGPGDSHLRAVEADQTEDLAIYNPGRWTTDEITYFCGACHRTLEDVVGENLRGPITARFQPYRLVLSKCYSPTDPRISCITCHNPHQPRSRSAYFYDEKCLACHNAAPSASGDAVQALLCPVEDRNCAECHMPAITVPNTHFTFTDHYIHVARPGETFAAREGLGDNFRERGVNVAPPAGEVKSRKLRRRQSEFLERSREVTSQNESSPEGGMP